MKKIVGSPQEVCQTVRDEVMPPEKAGSWRFDGEVTQSFSDMLERSIPQYEVMRTTVRDTALNFLGTRETLLDLGCSRGDAIDQVLRARGAANIYIGVEASEPMVAAARNRFEGYKKWVTIYNEDLRTFYPTCMPAVIQSVLTLMFIPIEYRLQLVKKMYDSLKIGGALILVEKVLGSTADLDALMVHRHLRMKKSSGYTDDQILRKKLSLEGVLVPVTAKWNEEMLASAGFNQVDCFWRWMNFAGWVAVKG